MSHRLDTAASQEQAARGFVVLGVGHILSGIDHLLFLLCLIIPFRQIRGLIPVITAFTLGHSVTLLGSAFNIAPRGSWFPPFVETAIAASIVYMALENVVGANLRAEGPTAIRRFASADLAVFVQRGHRTGATRGAVRGRSGAGSAIPWRACRAHRNYLALRNRRPHRLALDDGSLERVIANAVAASYRPGPDGICALGCSVVNRRRPCETPRQVDRIEVALPLCVRDTKRHAVYRTSRVHRCVRPLCAHWLN